MELVGAYICWGCCQGHREAPAAPAPSTPSFDLKSMAEARYSTPPPLG